MGFAWHIVLWQKYDSPDNVNDVWRAVANDDAEARGSGPKEYVCEKNITTSSPRCDSDWTAFVELRKCFKRSNKLEKRNKALEFCAEAGGRLAIIHSYDENRAVARV